MERITKASINGISFAMTDEAFHILDARLGELSRMGSTMGQYEKSIADFLLDNGGRDSVIDPTLARRAVEHAGGPRPSANKASGKTCKNEDRHSGGCLKALLTALLVILCFPLAVVVLGLLIAAACAILGITVAGLGTGGLLAGMMGTLGGLGLAGGLGVRMLVLLLVLLPIVCVIWAMVVLFSKNRAGKWKPLLVVFLIWLLAAIVSASVLGCSFRKFSATTSRTESSTSYILESDTLYVRMEPVERGENDGMLVYGNDDVFFLAYAPKGNGRGNRIQDLKSAILYPSIELEDDWQGNDSVAVIRLSHKEIKKMSGSNERDEQDFLNGLSSSDSYRMEGDTLVILPSKADFREGFKLNSLTIRHPYGIKVVVTGPVPHDFETTTSFQNVFSRRIELDALMNAIDELD